MTFDCSLCPDRGCCCGIVPLSKEVWEKNQDKKQREVKEIVEIDEEICVICEGAKCVFLNPENKKCEIYLDRPQVCRNYGIGKCDGLSCPYIKPNGKPRTPAMIKRVQRQINHDVDAKIRRVKKWGKNEKEI